MSAKFFRKMTSSMSSSGSTVSSPSKMRSPSSPTRTTRLQEKEELVGLNNRLAAYIEKVRSLEQENDRLTLHIKSSQEVVTKEVDNIKTLYEDELATTRSILDETASERAKLQIDLGNANTDKEELSAKLSQRERDLKKAEEQLDHNETQLNELQVRLNKTLQEKRKTDTEVKELKLETAKLRKQLEETRAQLESESLGRVDLVNKLQSQREDFEFKINVFEEQLKESYSRRSLNVSEVDGVASSSLQSAYEDRLRTALQELRQQYETQMKNNRDEIENLYDRKLEELRGSHSRTQQSSASTMKELRETRARIETLSARVMELENTNATLVNRVRDLETQLDNERLSCASQLAARDEELNQLQKRMQDQLQEYQDLMDIKVSLDLEIAAYHKLLESEENRLNLSPLGRRVGGRFGGGGGDHDDTPSSLRSGKRKRTVLESSEHVAVQYSVSDSCHGDVEIVDECADGKFVTLRNKADKEVSLGGMQLARYAGDAVTDYKFHRAVKLASGETATVWGAESAGNVGIVHDPPHCLVMRAAGWCTAPQMSTTLYNMDGQEVAKRVSQRTDLESSVQHEHHSGDNNGSNVSSGGEWNLMNLFGGSAKRG